MALAQLDPKFLQSPTTNETTEKTEHPPGLKSFPPPTVD